MALLAVDTATEICGLALYSEQRTLLELNLSHGQTHAKFLMTAVRMILTLTHRKMSDLEAFVVDRGPGSFTGLRIGISTIKGLAVAAGKPVVGISSLEVLAHQAVGDSALICPMLDARRQEVYWTLYRREGSNLTQVYPEHVGPVDDALERIEKSCLFIGSGARVYRSLIQTRLKHRALWPPIDQHDIRGAVLARLGWRQFKEGGFQEIKELIPVYLRQSDAELKRR